MGGSEEAFDPSVRWRGHLPKLRLGRKTHQMQAPVSGG